MILFINGCIREESRTLELANYLLNKLEIDKEVINLSKINLKPLDSDLLQYRDKLIYNKEFDNEFFDLANKFKNADTIVIATPYYDLSFSSLIKLFIENVNVTGLTFDYNESGIPYSLIKCKKLYYITTSGGPIINDNYGYGYIKEVFYMFYNVKDFKYIKAENLDIIGSDVNNILNETKKEIDKLK